MPKYTTKLESNVHHTRKDCTVGNNIEKRNKVPGTRGRRKCKECK